MLSVFKWALFISITGAITEEHFLSHKINYMLLCWLQLTTNLIFDSINYQNIFLAFLTNVPTQEAQVVTGFCCQRMRLFSFTNPPLSLLEHVLWYTQGGLAQDCLCEFFRYADQISFFDPGHLGSNRSRFFSWRKPQPICLWQVLCFLWARHE